MALPAAVSRMTSFSALIYKGFSHLTSAVWSLSRRALRSLLVPSSEPDRVRHVLLQSFGLNDFREGQRDIIDAILTGQDVVAVMPTGGGKSLCYQLPALLLPGLTVVVSPLIALMKDQVDALLERGLMAAFINSSQSPEEQTRALQLAARGQLKLLYIAPERFRSQQFMRALSSIDVSLFAVDEAHCLSQWGHDFRPDYMRLGAAVQALGRPPIAAFTATATKEVRDDICAVLKLQEPQVFFAGIDRDNLRIEFLYIGGKGGAEIKHRAILGLIRQQPSANGLIYASTRKNVERVAEKLRTEGVRVGLYHAGLSDDERVRVQDLFMAGKYQVMVATNAFGMGVDKSDIRYVVHYDIPGSVEAWYQEIGRAGRDRKPARCLTLFAESDRFIQEYFLQGSNPPREVIEEVHRVLCQLDGDTIELTVEQISERMSSTDNDMAVGTSLKVLERFGVVNRGFRGESKAWVKFRKPHADILRALARAPVQRALAEVLPQAVNGDPMKGADVDVQTLCFEAGVDREQALRMLGELARAGQIDYEPPFRGRSTRVLYRDGELPIDWNILEEKARRDLEKLDMVVMLARSEACRKWFLRRYFTGDGGKTFCNSCDRCGNMTREELDAAAEHEESRAFSKKIRQALAPARMARTSKPLRRQPLDGEALRVVQQALNCVARLNGRFGRNRIAGVLKGSRDKELIQWGLDSQPSYGVLADLKLEDILSLLDCLIEGSLLTNTIIDQQSTHRITVLEVTEQGRTVGRGLERPLLSLPSALAHLQPGNGPTDEGTEAGGYDVAESLSVSSTPTRRERGGRSASGGLQRPGEGRGSRRGESPVPSAAAARGPGTGRSHRNAPEGGLLSHSPRLYEALVKWRTKRARQDNVQLFMVLNNATLEALARMKPTTPEGLLAIKGLGPMKVQHYGEELLELIINHKRSGLEG